MVQANTELTVMLICTVQYLNSAVNIQGVKSDKVVDFPKFGHNYKSFTLCIVDNLQLLLYL